MFFFWGGGGGELSLKNCVDFILNSEINFILYIEFKKESQFYTKLNNYFDFTVDFFYIKLFTDRADFILNLRTALFILNTEIKLILRTELILH